MEYPEIIGILAGIFVLISFKLSGERKIRLVNIVGALLFVIYGIMIGSISIWLLNVLLIIIHGFKLIKLGKNEGETPIW